MREGEDVYSALGRSHGGRYLIVFFICKTDNRALVISAREITASEKNVMQNAKTSVSNADCYEAIGEFWDAHDLGEHWDATRPAEFEVITQEERNYFPVETNLTQQLRAVAQRDGISVEALVNVWLQERLAQEARA